MPSLRRAYRCDPAAMSGLRGRCPAGEKSCPSCGGNIKPEAKKCKHCGHWVNERSVEAETGNDEYENDKGRTVPSEIAQDILVYGLSRAGIMVKYELTSAEADSYIRAMAGQGLLSKKNALRLIGGNVLVAPPVQPSPMSVLSVAAGISGLLSFLIVPAPIGLLISCLAIRESRKRKGESGAGPAWFGIISGLLGTFILVVLLLAQTPK